MTRYPVFLYIYDLSGGWAKKISNTFRQESEVIEAVWHTSIVVHGKEVWYGPQSGVNHARMGRCDRGFPMRIVKLGYTTMTFEEFEIFRKEADAAFPKGEYNLLKHNCNSFSQYCATHLTRSQIPTYIKDLPSLFENTAFGRWFAKRYEVIQVKHDTEHDMSDPTIYIIGGRVLKFAKYLTKPRDIPLLSNIQSTKKVLKLVGYLRARNSRVISVECKKCVEKPYPGCQEDMLYVFVGDVGHQFGSRGSTLVKAFCQEELLDVRKIPVLGRRTYIILFWEIVEMLKLLVILALAAGAAVITIITWARTSSLRGTLFIEGRPILRISH